MSRSKRFIIGNTFSISTTCTKLPDSNFPTNTNTLFIESIILTSWEKLSLSNLRIRGSDDFRPNYKTKVTGREDFKIHEVDTYKGWIYLEYCREDSPKRTEIRCKKVVGLKLEFEVKYRGETESSRCTMEYGEDPVLGKLIYIKEYSNKGEHTTTVLEDGTTIILEQN